MNMDGLKIVATTLLDDKSSVVSHLHDTARDKVGLVMLSMADAIIAEIDIVTWLIVYDV